MKAVLVINEFLKSKKFDEIYDFLIKAAKKRNIEIQVLTNVQVLAGAVQQISDRPDFILFWDKDVRAAEMLENQGYRVFNSSSAIAVCDDKSLTYLKLMNAGIKMPKTFVSPLTYGLDDVELKLLGAAEKELKYPIIIKENCGSFGMQVYRADNHEQAEEIIRGIEGGYIIQEYIRSSEGRDIRINMVGDKCITAMLRTNNSDFRANITGGGKAEKFKPTESQIDMARRVMRELKLDFAGVDIMFGPDDEPIFCEVNSNAHFKNIYDCTGVNVAESIVEYIKYQVFEENLIHSPSLIGEADI